MHYDLLLSDVNCQVFIYSINLEVIRVHERWIGLSGRGQEGDFGANVVLFHLYCPSNLLFRWLSIRVQLYVV
jgi:hypothetical protein